MEKNPKICRKIDRVVQSDEAEKSTRYRFGINMPSPIFY